MGRKAVVPGLSSCRIYLGMRITIVGTGRRSAYLIEHPGPPRLPTESEKVAAFEALGLHRALLPGRVCWRAAGGARRYFPPGIPVALDSVRAVFVHADPR